MRSPRVPRRIKVGAVTYRVRVRDLVSEDGKVHFGRTDHPNATITLSSELSKDVLRATLLHELLHAMWTSICGQQVINQPETETDREEWLVRLVSDPLLLVLRDNPELAVWLTAP